MSVPDEKRFDEIAYQALKHLEQAVGDLDPDDVETTFTGDVLTLEFADKTKYVINSHRAARQIWMAGERRAWHFDFEEANARWVVHDRGDELYATIGELLTKRLGRPISV